MLRSSGSRDCIRDGCARCAGLASAGGCACGRLPQGPVAVQWDLKLQSLRWWRLRPVAAADLGSGASANCNRHCGCEKETHRTPKTTTAIEGPRSRGPGLTPRLLDSYPACEVEVPYYQVGPETNRSKYASASMHGMTR